MARVAKAAPEVEDSVAYWPSAANLTLSTDAFTTLVADGEVIFQPQTPPPQTPTPLPTEKPTPAPTATPKPTEAPTPKPTIAPTPKPTATPKISLSKCKITVKDQVYTGKALKPAVTVKYGKETLKKGTDFTVVYKNNKAIGTAAVTVKGKGKYTGTAKAVTVKK